MQVLIGHEGPAERVRYEKDVNLTIFTVTKAQPHWIPKGDFVATCYHNHCRKTKLRNIFWRNVVYPSKRVSETCNESVVVASAGSAPYKDSLCWLLWLCWTLSPLRRSRLKYLSNYRMKCYSTCRWHWWCPVGESYWLCDRLTFPLAPPGGWHLWF